MTSSAARCRNPDSRVRAFSPPGRKAIESGAVFTGARAEGSGVTCRLSARDGAPQLAGQPDPT